MAKKDEVKEEHFIRYRKVSGRHHYYCPFRKRKAILGPKGCPDGNIGYFRHNEVPDNANHSWERMDSVEPNKVLEEEVGEPDGVLKMVKNGKRYDIINTATGDAINTAPLTKKEAEEMVAGYVEPSEEEEEEDEEVVAEFACPEEYDIYKDYDEREECDDCKVHEECAALYTVAQEKDEDGE